MIKLEDIEQALKQQKVPTDTISKVIQSLVEVEEEKKADKDPVSRQKKQWVVVAIDPSGILKNQTLAAAVLQIEDGPSPSVAVDRLKAAAAAYNNTKKGRRVPALTLAQALEIPRKFSKTEQVMVKTKEFLELVTSDNKI